MSGSISGVSTYRRIDVSTARARAGWGLQESILEADVDPGPLWPLQVFDDSSPLLGRGARLFSVGVLFGLITVASNAFTLNHWRVCIFWPANGMLVAYLLTRPTRDVWKVLISALLGNVFAQHFLPGSTFEAWFYAFCNLTEVAVAAMLLRRGLRRFGDLASPGMMVNFCLHAVLLAPATAAVLACAYARARHGAAVVQTFQKWFPADALGMALMIPLTLALLRPDIRSLLEGKKLPRSLGATAAVLGAACIVFGQTRYPMLFLLFPLVMVVVFEAGVFATFLVLLEMLIVGAEFTMHRMGPFWLHRGATAETSVLRLQLYVLVMMASAVPVGAALARQRQLRSSLREGLKRYRLLAENSRDIVLLSDLEGQRLYVSPAVTDLLGWSPEEWNNQNSSDLMHPDDVAPFRRMLKELLHGQDRRTFCYRTRHKNGKYVHMEASVRALQDDITGKPTAFVANVRDVSQRVDAERKLALAYEQMQEQAHKDGLTGLANRRRFDESLDAEWRRGRRTGRNLALIMVDIDNFKRLNDTYGHRAGDYCLQAVAACLRMTARRPSDVVARYGGEEFALLLPDVEIATALVMAESLCMKVREQRIDAGIGRDLTLTVSVGVVAQIPDTNFRADVLVEAADRALYAAKQAGRNCVVTGTSMDEPASSPYHVH